MNNYVWAGPVSALLVVVAGILTCFRGYRILKVTLGLLGFIAGAYAGWELGMSPAHASTGIALGAALIGGLIGMALYVWLYFLGIFLLGVTAGAIVAAAFFNGTGHPAEPIIFVTISIVFGLIALAAQKFMLIIATAFTGSYLIMAGVWPFIAGSHNPSQIWLYPIHNPSAGTLGYAALAFWLVLGLAGLSVQFRSSPRKAEATDKPK
jgi:hypothetical protein